MSAIGFDQVISWLNAQFTRWEEIALGITLLLVGLFLEDWIDQCRAKRRDKAWMKHVRASGNKALAIRHKKKA